MHDVYVQDVCTCVCISVDIQFVGFYVCFEVLALFVQSKHFNHPHPCIEIATTISDYYYYEHKAMVKYHISSSSTRMSNSAHP